MSETFHRTIHASVKQLRLVFIKILILSIIAQKFLHIHYIFDITRNISSSYCELIFNEVYIVEIHMKSYHNVMSTNTPIAKYTNHETVSLSILHNAHKDRNDFYTQ